jgi:hypothetical protein
MVKYNAAQDADVEKNRYVFGVIFHGAPKCSTQEKGVPYVSDESVERLQEGVFRSPS